MRIRFAFPIFMGLLVLAVAGWSTMTAPPVAALDPTETPVAPALQTPAPAPALPAPQGNPLDNVVKAENSFVRSQSATLKMDVTSPDGVTDSTRVDYVAPDRMHVVVQAESQRDEFIIIKGQGTWANVKGEWQQSTVDDSPIAFALFDQNVVTSLSQALTSDNVAYMGPDSINGQPMYVYKFTVTNSPAPTNPLISNGTYMIWLGSSDGQPYRLQGTFTNPSGQGMDSVSANMTYTPVTPVQAPK